MFERITGRRAALAIGVTILSLPSLLCAGEAAAKSGTTTRPPPATAKETADEEAEHSARCVRLTDEIKKHIAAVKALEKRRQDERNGPPTSLSRAWERMTGAPERDQQQTVDQLALEREKIAVMSTGLVANSCPPLDPELVKAANP